MRGRQGLTTVVGSQTVRQGGRGKRGGHTQLSFTALTGHQPTHSRLLPSSSPCLILTHIQTITEVWGCSGTQHHMAVWHQSLLVANTARRLSLHDDVPPTLPTLCQTICAACATCCPSNLVPPALAIRCCCLLPCCLTTVCCCSCRCATIAHLTWTASSCVTPVN